MHISAFLRKPLMLGAVLLLAQGGAALAQDTPRGTDEEITVDGPYRIQRVLTQEAHPLGKEETISISRAVRYNDLDLSQSWGRTLLRLRINDTANDVCFEIDRRFPGASNRSECVFNAKRDAREAVMQSIARNGGRTNVAALP